MKDALVYLCDECGTVAGTPQITSGRVFAAMETRRKHAAPTDIRVPKDAEDLAFSIHAALGLRPTGDVYRVPIALGMRNHGMKPEPLEEWRVLDKLDMSERARPILSEEVIARLDGLAKTWKADRSTVARWLVVAAAKELKVL